MLFIIFIIFSIAIAQSKTQNTKLQFGTGNTNQRYANTTERLGLISKHSSFNNQFTLVHFFPLILAYQSELRSLFFVTILYTFLKFFGKLHSSTVWALPTVGLYLFINNGPIPLIIGLEALALALVSVLIRFINSNLNKNDQKKLLVVFILNTVSFIVLVFVLGQWSLFTQVHESGLWSRPIKGAIIVYFLIKFGTLLSSVLKIFFYESIPLRNIVTISLIQVVLVPVVLFTTTYQIFDGFEAICLFVFLAFNIPFMPYLINTKNLVHLVAYTTALTNSWAILLFIL